MELRVDSLNTCHIHRARCPAAIGKTDKKFLQQRICKINDVFRVYSGAVSVALLFALVGGHT